MKKIVAITAVLGVLMAGTSFAAEEVPVAAASTGTTTQGSQLMTQQERAEHRNKMQSAKTEQERQQIRSENHETMRKRAEEKGMSIPENAPSTGMHQGRGMQGGSGMMGGAGMGRGGSNR
ncbi:hypothetical protein HFU84_11215 [Acidithiobacillus sp. CV18-2]|uniref:DUF4890 domain-containing protein n=1 Tax=Igneacidithiobacillus copahuensis TaxID=2724909 RepID=A0AAE2YMX0_9PROT|nr:hypothetical protein [Igneacidithiobacillus copahuensis]MBU2753726.1 hypothetical protein [Acidithiobacillus sp. CV18-3]MBU2758282.1 hypothetical protein [Acidithiobacillus sp. BN09-2]MBU2778065.1 hypothetical protein [Acidithiobacillus sp. CV18-2]MBU2796045.1 hypothetical protein [Acidithiobacillus sp. VAN18-2]MBU2798032.1 hypothetical protein [Acidithiobacillus sp. VAN18-4]UTV80316.1 hypothetical protein MQE22_09840 [Acidithiobacillus sp. YTS05]